MRPHTFFRVRGTTNLGVAAHVPLGALGVTFADVVEAHSGAVDNWEAESLRAVRASEFTSWAASVDWTPWGLTCWAGAVAAAHPALAA